MWRTFKRFGDLSDIYMAKRRLINGGKFGFVRFKHVDNEVLLEKRLRDIWIGNFRLRVHLAKQKVFERPAATSHLQKENHLKVGSSSVKKEAKSYAEAVKEGKRKKDSEDNSSDRNTNSLKAQGKTDCIVLGSWTASDSELDFLKLCAVGHVTKLEHFEAVQALIKTLSLEDSEAKLIGGR
ncbi:hypothetical protein OSB04_031358 [Centaurea solstitialis]|uniref:RRM domain-containing protein n=1 Tax=Centaurea solstitialis TaxID=347529 RepID=A0AA38W4N5_9ASTR|nr:hypothetical protein OSB04_031358 [Centaurea solstitialis]